MTIFRNDRTTWNISSRDQWLAKRQNNIGASDIAALFHAHKYTSAFKLWCLHTNRLRREHNEDSDALRRGRIMEPAVAEALREAHPEWIIASARQYVELTDLRIAASPDFYAWPSAEALNRGEGQFLIQAKTVTEDIYEEEYTPAPPASHLLQAQAEMMITGLQRNILAVMVLDGRKFPVHEYPLVADGEIHDQIAIAAKRFWHCVAKDEEPKLHHPQDAWAIARLHPDAGDEAVLALHGSSDVIQTCQAYQDVSTQLKALEGTKEALASKLKGILRNHARAEAQGWRINWPSVPEVHVAAHVKKAHRRFSITKIRKQGD